MNAVWSQKTTEQKVSKKPQPKWFVLQSLNYVVLAIFVGSVTYAGLNYRKISSRANTSSGDGSSTSPLTSFLFPLMILWTLCLAYFFGFFGISLVDTEALGESPSSFGLAELQKEADTKAAKAKATAHAPRNDAPICNPEPTKTVPRTLPSTAPAAADGEEEPDYAAMSDEDILETLLSGKLKDYQLEKKLGATERAVFLRRMLYENILDRKLDLIPFTGFNYGQVFGANCEIVIGYVPIPLGVVGPITINSEPIYIPMATTEGCLVASTNRGCKAISASGGCNSILLKDAITRAPCLRFPSAMRAAALKKWCSIEVNYLKLEAAFNGTTNFGKLQSCDVTCAGRNAYLRFCCMSGDAMGMNMVSKGCLAAIEVLEEVFPDMILVAISGNMCTDKKPAAINWILGRGKSVIVEAVIPDRIVKAVLKSSVHDMIETNKQKNHIGSAMAGSIGGFNAHAANIVTAVFLATGQDPAQNVESSNCLTIMEYAEDGESLHVSVTMPSIEVGTVGGGTSLPAQAGCLEIAGVRGAARGEGSSPGDNARKLAMIVGAATLAGELSLIAALAANHLVRSHMQHNRKPQTTEATVVSTMKKNASMPELQNRS
jgi:hydroxymethylglutaryl-CoA reductase (NADPH)